jgi:simple sugar transport system permease protein
MKDKAKKLALQIGVPRLIIIGFFIFLCIMTVPLELPLRMIISDILVRLGMNGMLVLSMVPAILCGVGLNFGLPIGVLAGVLAGLISIELGLAGWAGIAVAILLAIPFGAIVGYLYGLLLNKVKGSEMMIGTYAGFSAVSLMCIGWLLLPFKSGELKWPIGQGLRTTITLENYYSKILDNFLAFNLFGIDVPTGILLFVIACSVLMWLFLRSKTGLMMVAAGSNPNFAKASAISTDKMRLIGTTISTAISAVGIVIYAQSFGFYQLYNAPLMMAFGAVAAILIGGASTSKAKIKHIFIGTCLFQGLLALGLPVANAIVPEGNLSEVLRMIISNGIILYALTKASGGESRA